MKGAREYAELFKTGQYGKLYLASGSHARGLTFRIQILPEGEKAISNGVGNTCVNNNAVEVYGVISGQRGWTECYGWLHEGQWQKDFETLVQYAKKSRQDLENEIIQRKNKRKQMEKKEQDKLLAAYN